MPKERHEILAEARRIRAEIEQIFIDAEHWNRIHPSEEPIHPDPDGRLRRLAKGIDQMLASDPGRGPLAEIVERDDDGAPRC
ncbi:MAG: hypothetical protein AB7R67_20095 [Vicinamibacterales bacterium]